MNIQPDILFFVIFVLSSVIHSCGAIGGYERNKYRIFSKSRPAAEKQTTDYPEIFSLLSKYNVLRRRRESSDAILIPNRLLMKRFFHYSPFIMKSKNSKSRKPKVKTIQRNRNKHSYTPFHSFGIFIKAHPPNRVDSDVGGERVSEIVPESESIMERKKQKLSDLLHANTLELPGVNSQEVPNLSEIDALDMISPEDIEIPTNNMEDLYVDNDGNIESDDTNSENKIEVLHQKKPLFDAVDQVFRTDSDQIDQDLFSGMPVILPEINDVSAISEKYQNTVNGPSKETAKSLDLPPIIIDPIHQRASVAGWKEQSSSGPIHFNDFDEFQNPNVYLSSSDPNKDVLQDFGNTDQRISEEVFPDQIHFSDESASQGDFFNPGKFSEYGGVMEQDDLEYPMSPFDGPSEGDFSSDFTGQFGDFGDFDNLNSDDITGGTFLNDGNDYEGFFDTDEVSDITLYLCLLLILPIYNDRK